MRSFSDLELANEHLSIKSVLSQVLHAARESLSMEFAFISELKDGCRIFRLIDQEAGAPDILQIDHGDASEQSYCQRVLDGRLPALMRNAVDFKEAVKLQVTHELPVGAHISVPIFADDGSVFGTFCCFSRMPNYNLTSKDLASLRAFSDLASELLRNSLAQDREMLALRHLVQDMIERGDFSIVCQPIYDLEKGAVIGYEALTRFNSDAGLTTEEWFVNAAKVGLSYELECATGQKAFDMLPRLAANQYLTINVSPTTILSCQNLQAMFGQYADRIVLEITEHDEISDYAQVSEVLAPLREQGLRLAVDDAGAGYASFRHILLLKPDVIKLDRSLINGIDSDPSQYALATAIVAFAESTQSTIVAEGIETDSELNAIRQLNIHLGQGYLLGRPAALN
ncbi:Putative cyclic-di-GMP phosphodiesterase AdrB [Marinomonas aquimarina]|uniref:Putative cyclic-di-GMP phosphodiesterase AdrB n=1 Tax=Marinomonas aquimarina TaxID=295068 RepID=A0A1A8TC35_9GAMM|nr:EAL domain-containing protein [Marinomonas aquimarina]SBS30566.1 Putative cyclic-di-GMP phosphodiesterase AdrB [Marinomonas aquimarina]